MAMLFICYNTSAKTGRVQEHSGNASTRPQNMYPADKKLDFLVEY